MEIKLEPQIFVHILILCLTLFLLNLQILSSDEILHISPKISLNYKSQLIFLSELPTSWSLMPAVIQIVEYLPPTVFIVLSFIFFKCFRVFLSVTFTSTDLIFSSKTEQ